MLYETTLKNLFNLLALAKTNNFKDKEIKFDEFEKNWNYVFMLTHNKICVKNDEISLITKNELIYLLKKICPAKIKEKGKINSFYKKLFIKALKHKLIRRISEQELKKTCKIEGNSNKIYILTDKGDIYIAGYKIFNNLCENYKKNTLIMLKYFAPPSPILDKIWKELFVEDGFSFIV